MSKTIHRITGNLAVLTGAVALLVMASEAQAGNLKVDCLWSDGAVTIDGEESEWPEGRIFLEDIKGGVGAMNDGEFAYVHLATIREDLAHQILTRGMVVWFDPDGSDKKVIGIRFPLGARGQSDFDPREKTTRLSSDDLAAMIDGLSPELEILNEDGEVLRRFRTDARPDIDAEISYNSGRLIYELKVPLYLNADHPFAIGAVVGTEIGIGFETPEFEFDRSKMQGMRGGKGGRGGGGMGGRGGTGGSMNRGSRPEHPEPLKLWTKARLATTEDTQNDN